METIWVAGGESAALGAGMGLRLGRLNEERRGHKQKGKTLSTSTSCLKKKTNKKTVLGMMACAAAGAAVISKSAGAMFSNESVPADEGLLKKGNATGRAVERVDVSSKTTTTTATSSPSPPSGASPPS